MSSLIFFLGYMGSGKSTIGTLYAEKMGFDFVDLDDYIEEKAQKSIKEIFSNQGEDAFRRMEKEALVELSDREKTVVSLGGGTPCYYDNMTVVNNAGISFWLYVDVETIYKRLKSDTTRPIWIQLSKSEVEEHSTSRESYYSQANYILDGSLSPENIITEIEKLLQ